MFIGLDNERLLFLHQLYQFKIICKLNAIGEGLFGRRLVNWLCVLLLHGGSTKNEWREQKQRESEQQYGNVSHDTISPGSMVL